MAEAPTVFAKRAPDGAWEIPILGDIGFFGTNGEDLIRELQAVKPETVKFIIYSPGGAVYDAIAVAGWLIEHKIKCYAEIYGVCASAATVFAAVAGPKNTAIAPGSMFLVHMPFGGDQKAIDNAADFMIDLYAKAYGWSKAEARKHMEANNGDGVLWNVKEAKTIGVVGEIMEGAKVAARLHLNEQTIAMSENKIKVEAFVKLGAADAIKAVAGGVKAEVEIDATDEQKALKELADQATADRIAAETKAKEDTDAANAMVEAAKKKEEDATAALAAKEVERAAQEELAKKAAQEADAAKAENVTVQAALTKANALITELSKLPTAPAVIAAAGGDVQEPAGELNVPPTAAKAFADEFFKDMTPAQRIQYEKAVEAKKAK